MVEYDEALKRKNKRTAWMFGIFAVVILLTSFPFWINIFKIIAAGTQ